MIVKEIEMTFEGDLVITEKTLHEAGLKQRVRLLVHDGEIRILPEGSEWAEEALDDLAGALGEEPATSYDFTLKYGGLYEAR